MVHRLVKRGFVDRARDAADDRRVTIRRTAYADAVSQQVFAPMRQWSRQNLAGYSVEELELLAEYTRISRQTQQKHLMYIEQLDADEVSARARAAVDAEGE